MKKRLKLMLALMCVCSMMLGIVGCSAFRTATKEQTVSSGEFTIPTEGATESTKATTEFTEATTESTEETTESTEETTESTEATTESTEVTTESTEVTTESTEATTESTEATTESTEETTESTEETTESTEETTEFAEETTESTEESTESTEEMTESTEETTESTKETTESVEETTESTEESTESTEDDLLAEEKTEAKAALDTYVNANDYRAAQKAELATAIASGKSAIDAAADKAAVEAALGAAKVVIDAIPTDAELTAKEEAELVAAKTEAKAALDTYANADDYRETQKAELAAAIANGKTAIDAAMNKAAVETALEAAKAMIDAIPTDAEITANSPTITTTITDGMTFTNSKATLDVWVKDSKGNKLAASKVTVTVNGVEATINWDDNQKTSYNFLFENGENTIVITAVDGIYSTVVTYVVNCDTTAPTTITVSIEGFTVGKGYFVAPIKVVLDNATLTEMAGMYGYADAAQMQENLTAAYVLDYTLQTHGLTMDYQGDLCSGGSFYMSSVSGIDTSDIIVSEELQSALEGWGLYPDPESISEEGTLGEFDVTFGSGWMYMINNEGPNVGFCDYIPQDGDVMRIQFTLGYGCDIGISMVGELWFEIVDRDALTECIADAIVAGVDYSEALEVISTFGVTQDELDDACVALRNKIGS